jgi:hypothetical protein
MHENDDIDRHYLEPLLAVAYAMYYATWHARKHEIATNDQRYDGPLPNDIADVSEKTLAECLEITLRTITDEGPDRQRIDNVLNSIQRVGEGSAADIGKPIVRFDNL